MATLKLGSTDAITESGGVVTFPTASSTIKYPAGHQLQQVCSSNDLVQLASITSSTMTQHDSLPYVDIVPKATNSLYHIFCKIYGSWNTSQPILAPAVSSTAGNASNTYTHKIGTSNWSYGSAFTWGVMNGEFNFFFEDQYPSTFTAGQANIRFALGYANVYHSSAQNSYVIGSGEDNAGHIIVKEIAT